MPPEDIARNANISLKTSIIDFIDDNRVGHGYKNRSDYVQDVVLKEITRGCLDVVAELISMLILPMMFFGFFMVCAVLTKGTLFFLFMGISGIFAIVFSLIYYNKHKPKKMKR